MAGSQILYRQHREWALSLTRSGSDEDRLTALLALARCAHEYVGHRLGFKAYARPRIEEALHRKAAA